MLLLVPAALVPLTAATWFERHAAARAAADEAARAVVLADTWGEGATAAQDVVDEVTANYDLDPGDLTLRLDGDLSRGATVTAQVTVTIPAAALPLVGDVGAFSRTVSHTETVDRYRSHSSEFRVSEGSGGSNPRGAGR
jgi:hypothetical protein